MAAASALVNPFIVSEDHVHLSVAHALARLVAPPGVRSRHDVMWITIEHRNARNALEGATRKARGVVRGVPDVLVMHGARYLWIELKRPRNGVVSKDQKRLHADIHAMGGIVSVCRSLDEVLTFLTDNSVPLAGKIAA